LPQHQAKTAGKSIQQGLTQLLGVELRPPIHQTPHGPITESTGHHCRKASQVAIHIQGQAVLADPAPGPHTDRRQLAALQPHPGEPIDPLALQIQTRQHIDHNLLELAQIQVQVSAVALQIEHWVEHQLARGVVGHLAATVNAVQGQGRCGGIEAQKGLRCAAAQGVAGLMLKQDHGVRALGIVQQPLLQLALDRPGPFKRHRDRRFKKDCIEVGGYHKPFLALVHQKTGGGCHLMKLLIHGRNLDVTPAIREYTETKLTRAIHHFEGLVKEADVHLSVARNPRVPQQTVEVTMFANGTVIRAQERSDNLYASIDLVASKLSRQLLRYKDRIQEQAQGPVHRSARDEEAGAAANLPAPGSSLVDGKEPELPSPGVRRKYYDMPSMSIDDALHQLELIDHDFYVFRDAESGQIQVVYHRNHGGFGVIQAKDA